MAYCGEQVAVKNENRTLIAVSLKCRSWGCENCQDQRKKQLIAQGMGGAPNIFLTLTYRIRKDKTPDQAALELSRAWRLVRLRLMRKFKWTKLPFLAVVEKTINGWPHLHIMIRSRYIPFQLIRDWMSELIDSPHIWIEKIDNKARVAGYVAKYCGKATQKFDTAKRYWQSRDYDLREAPEPKDKHVPGFGWEMWPQNLRSWVKAQEQIFRVVEWLGNGKAISTPALWDPI